MISMQHFNRKQIVIAIILLVGVVSAIFFRFSEPEKKVEKQVVTSVQEKKARFRALIVPAVNTVYADLMNRYEEVKKLTDAGETSNLIEKLKAEYKVMTDRALLMAIKPHPKSITLAQAAMESSWATSRFFREANNIFGVWSFNKNEPRIAALEKRDGKTIWVKKYASIEQAIYDYYRTMGRSDAFVEFRQAKMETDDPFVLVKKLDHYSEKGSLYGEELASIIRFNKFDEYD